MQCRASPGGERQSRRLRPSLVEPVYKFSRRIMNTETLIAEILARPPIWKSGHPQHKYKQVLKRLWEEVKVKFPNSEVGDLKKRWKNLRDTYTKELKKIKSNASSSYEPAWKYFTLLGFMKDEYMSLTADSNLDEEESVIIDNGGEDTERIFVETLNEATSPPSTRTSSPIEPSTSSSQNSRKKRQNIQDIREQYLEIERKKLKLLENDIYNYNTPVDTEKKSDDYYFLMSILPEMEKLPTVQKLRLRNKINQALLDEINVTMYGEPRADNCPLKTDIDQVSNISYTPFD
uniref:MADF domain-containing protein n=1 Tax=Heliothis virescens TaxID=7102 RepID=A0A2A4JRU4_HELVI